MRNQGRGRPPTGHQPRLSVRTDPEALRLTGERANAVGKTVLIWLSFTLRMYQLRWFGVAVSAAFAVWLLSVDTPEGLDRSLRPILNVYLP